MEDALVRKVLNSERQTLNCLNHCCNGRCTRTIVLSKNCVKLGCLNPCCNGRCTRTIREVWNKLTKLSS